jgi:hypothetical protein
MSEFLATVVYLLTVVPAGRLIYIAMDKETPNNRDNAYWSFIFALAWPMVGFFALALWIWSAVVTRETPRQRAVRLAKEDKALRAKAAALNLPMPTDQQEVDDA